MESSPSEAEAAAGWLELSVEVPEKLAPLATHALLELGATGIQEDHPGLHFGDDDDGPIVSGDPQSWTPPLPANPGATVQLKAWFPADSDRQTLLEASDSALAGLGIEAAASSLCAVPEQDWNATWKAGFLSFRLSPRLQVVPSWHEQAELEEGVHALHLDPGMAFGTGTHFTTAGCTQLLDGLLAQWQGPAPAVLDVGTGTGILALAALLLGAARAVGVDADPQAIEASRENARINRLDSGLDLYLGGPESAPQERFPIVLANLIAPLLLELSASLGERVAPGGTLILSGILCAQEAEVLAAFAGLGLQCSERLSDGEWVALRLSRGPEGSSK